MLSTTEILKIAEETAEFTRKLLGLQDKKYTISIVDKPEIDSDGYFKITTNEIFINIPHLSKFANRFEDPNENQRIRNEIQSIVFHELRHNYQTVTVNKYILNKQYGYTVIKMTESKEKCEKWLKDMQTYDLDTSQDTEIELDAGAFETYMLHRYPETKSMKYTDRRIGVMKRKYDKQIKKLLGEHLPS